MSQANRYLNMDWVRYVLATAVVVAHYSFLTGQHLVFPISSGSAVGIFFGLSGFLVYASYERASNLKQYIANRARRILPPYIFIVVGCAVGFAFISKLPIGQYFSDITFWRYLVSNLAFLNFLQPELPGVFEHSVTSAVNGSLWTLKVEWMLYLSIPIFCYVVRCFRGAFDYVIAGIFLLSVLYRQLMQMCYESTGDELYHILSYQFAGQMVYFYTGVLVFRHLTWVSAHRLQVSCLCIVALALAKCMEGNLPSSHWQSMLFNLVQPIAAVCIALVISISKPVLASVIQRIGNCSYEMYLFHFPIIQLAVLWALPFRFNPAMVFSLTMLSVFVISYIYNKGYSSFKNYISNDHRN